MQLFYNPTIEPNAKTITFDREESKHISKVLRKKEGDLLLVTDGKGNRYTTEITSANSNKINAKIQKCEVEEPRNYRLHLAVAPTKMNDRYEWFLEKSTEIGIDEITPIICHHSERKTIKLNRFQRVLQSAMKQSLHYRLPQLNEPISFAEFVENAEVEQLFIAHCEDQIKNPLQTMLQPKKNVLLLIGPEGDFSPEEITVALDKNFIPVSLGDSRLRTETAAIVGCHTVAMINEVTDGKKCKE